MKNQQTPSGPPSCPKTKQYFLRAVTLTIRPFTAHKLSLLVRSSIIHYIYPQLFEELRKIKRVGVLPVGFVYAKGALPNMVNHISRPMLRINGSVAKIVGWETNGRHIPLHAQSPLNDSRKYSVDMAGFAFGSSLLWEPTSKMTGRPQHPVRFVPRRKG